METIIFDPSPRRRAVLERLGARSVLDPTACDPVSAVRDLTGGRGAHAFPSVIEEMALGSYPLDGWVETIPFEGVVDLGLERLRRQEGLKILVEVGK